jgi:hypothetical protein
LRECTNLRAVSSTRMDDARATIWPAEKCIHVRE